MSYVLGVDAGNTKTIAMVARTDGTVVGAGRSGCGDIYGGEVAALDAIAAASREALAQAQLPSTEMAAVVLSAAGADWPEDFDTICDGAADRGIGIAPVVYNDAIGGLRAGSPDGTGVGIVCGTGSATGARSRDGRIWHSSFWQDPQGADQLGEIVVKAIVRTELGVASPTPLTGAVLQYLRLPTVEAALHALTARNLHSQPLVKSLAKVLLDVAASGDEKSLAIITAHGRALGDMALAAARKVGIEIEHESFHLVLTGGVLRHPSVLMRDAIVSRVREAAPNINVINDAMEPVFGAVMLAFEAANIGVTDEIKNRLRETSPDSSLFET